MLQELLNATTSDLEMLELHDILVLLIGGIIDVIQRQLYDYFSASHPKQVKHFQHL